MNVKNSRLLTTLALAALLLGSIAFVASCKNKSGSSRIVCTTGMVGDVVQRIVGTNETVQVLMQGSIDPHLYSPLGPDISALNRAEIIFYNGLHLEGRMGEILEDLEARDKTVVAIAETIPEASLIKEGEGEKSFDPHVWMSVSTWSQTIDTALETLTKADPDKADEYTANAEAFREEINELDAYVKSVIAKIPADKRILVTAHDAFAYFGRDYDLEVEGIQGISTDDEAGVQRINDLVDLLVSKKISAIFVESTVPKKHVDALREGAASKGHTVEIGGELFSDAMGQAGTYKGTYMGMIDHNATTVARALGGEDAAPAKGWKGKLNDD